MNRDGGFGRRRPEWTPEEDHAALLRRAAAARADDPDGEAIQARDARLRAEARRGLMLISRDWKRRMLTMFAVVVGVFAYEEVNVGLARQGGSDLRPGLRLRAEAYRLPRGCPDDLQPAPDLRFPAACLSGQIIPRREAFSYGVTPTYGRRYASRWRNWGGERWTWLRWRWFRYKDDAVLAACGRIVGCKATVVAPGRFHEAWPNATPGR